MTNFEFAIALAKSETEENVITLLKSLGYWVIIPCGRPLGGMTTTTLLLVTSRAVQMPPLWRK